MKRIYLMMSLFWNGIYMLNWSLIWNSSDNRKLGIAHFVAIWEVKDQKLYWGYQVSQPVTDKDDTNESCHNVKV